MQLPDKQKAILELLADGEFHSGSELASVLNLSRSAIWKYLHCLPELGIAYSAVSGKGYRLEKPLELLSFDAITAAMDEPARALLNKLEIHDSLPSTNSYISQLAQGGAVSGNVCFAEQQTAGKGRRGRQWISPYGYNIYLSALWHFQANPAGISGLSLAVGVAVIRALNNCFSNTYSLKWPNDIYYLGKKLGGILIEVSGESEGPSAAIIGIGLNRYLPAKVATAISQEWTDLSQIDGFSELSRNKLAGNVLNELFPILAEFQDTGITAFLDEWRHYDYLKEKPGLLYIGHHSYEGIVKGVDDNGLLLMTRPDGSTQAFASGEVSFSKTQP